jgi:uncharacterized protein with GYD domain
MPTYVVLVNWTEEGIKNVKETMERTDEGTDLAKKHGTEFKQAFWTVLTTWSPFSSRPTTRP